MMIEPTSHRTAGTEPDTAVPDTAAPDARRGSPRAGTKAVHRRREGVTMTVLGKRLEGTQNIKISKAGTPRPETWV